MDDHQTLHLRLSSCIQTMIEVHEVLNVPELMPELGPRFEELKKTLARLAAISFVEEDVCRVEEATNRLMAELRPIVGLEDRERLFGESTH